ncbi:MAG: sensor histidine kinase [Chitinophagaceae bacterium]|nr:MAG: sensor histidine kinase [Chitinophagaceae bacterium]
MDTTAPSLFLAILIACLIVGVLIIFFTATMLRYQKKNLILYKAKLAAEITTLEKERTRMAEDLHDELGPVLAGIKLKLNSLDLPEPRDKAMLDKVHFDIVALINRMKDISNDLMPAVLIKKGFVRAMEITAEEMNQHKGLEVHFSADDIPTLESLVSVNLYRICQEILTNTIKHARAKTLSIHFERSGHLLILTSVDDGKGFDHRVASSQGSGYGLMNLHNRTEMLGGELFVESTPGLGTKYRIEIPFSL